MNRSLQIVAFTGLIVSGQFWPAVVAAQDSVVGFTTTPMNVVEGMLDLGNVGPGDYVIDLGSGDGRIVIAAAKRGAVGHGIEIEQDLIEKSLRSAVREQVSDLVSFINEDFFETDIGMATVVTLYIRETMNIRLREKLLKDLKPGIRVISHRYKMGDWIPDASEEVDFRMIYMWIIPAHFEGEWHWNLDGNVIRMQVRQKYQEVTGFQVAAEKSGLNVLAPAVVNGKRFTFQATDAVNGIHYLYSGTLKEERIEGVVQIKSDKGEQVLPWFAVRQ